MSFVLTVLAVAAAVAVYSGGRIILNNIDNRAETALQIHEQYKQNNLDKMKNQVEESMEKLGFNIIILPENQDLGDYHSEDYAKETMPEDYALKLTKADLLTVKSLIARLKASVKWSEKKWTVILLGEAVPRMSVSDKPGRGYSLISLRPESSARIGSEIARGLSIQPGSEIYFNGTKLLVDEVLPEKGTSDDVTLFVGLETAQKLLNKTGLINEITAEQCRTSLNKLDNIRNEIRSVLPGVKVIETGTTVLAQYNALKNTEEKISSEKKEELQMLQTLRVKNSRKTDLLSLLSLCVCGVLLLILSVRNVRQRREEVGVFRAMGCSTGQVLSVLLARPLLAGVTGGALGVLAGGGYAALRGLHRIITMNTVLVSLAAAAGVALIAGMIPVLIEIFRDPTAVLKGK